MSGSGAASEVVIKAEASSDAILDNLFKNISQKITVKEEPESEEEEDSDEDSDDDQEDSGDDEQRRRRQQEEEEEENRRKRKKKEKKKHKHKKDKKKKRHKEHSGRDKEHSSRDKDRRSDRESRRSDRSDDDGGRRKDRRSERSEELITRKSRPMSPPARSASHAASRPAKSPPRHTRPLSPPPPPPRDHRDRDYRDSRRDRDRSRDRSRDRRDSSRDRDSRDSRRDSRQEERPPTRHTPKNDSQVDTFWDSKWEAKEIQKEAEAKERRGRHYLDNKRDKYHKENQKAANRVAEKKKRQEEKALESDEEESDELRRLKELQKVANLEVDDDKKYVAEPADPSQFEWNPVARMYQRKQTKSDDDEDSESDDGSEGQKEPAEEGEVPEDGSFDSDLKKRIDEQVKEGKRKFIPIDSGDTKALTMDEIEEIRKKREKFKKDKEKDGKSSSDKRESRKSDRKSKKKEEKEEGEVGSDDDHEPRHKRRRAHSPAAHRSSSRRSRSRDRVRARSRSRDRGRDRDSDRGRGGFGYHDYRGATRRRSRSRSRDRSRRSRSRDRSRRSRSRDRDRRRSPRGDKSFRSSRAEIDKAKLLAIARKNAVKLLNSDNLMGMDHDRLVAIKSGGQSLSQLTMFCRELAQKGITDDFDDDDAEIINRPVNSDDEREVHHPFAVKERAVPNPYMGAPGSSLRPAIELDSLTPQARLAARSHRMIEFPVSSGNAHRVKEVIKDPTPEPEPFPTDEAEKALALPGPNSPPPIVATQAVEPMADDDNLVSAAEKEAAEKVAKANFSNPLGQIMFGGAVDPTKIDKSLLEGAKQQLEQPEAAKPAETAAAAATTPAAAPVPAPTPAFVDPMLAGNQSKPLAVTHEKDGPDKVFEPINAPSKDIGSIVSNRLSAMKKLSSNPNDPEALREMYEAQKLMSSWAESKNKPGQFTGHTGAKVLSKAELELGVQAWAKQEQFTKAPKVSGGFGEFMLKKMGWSEGEGLGKERNGDVDPLTLDIKMDKRGLVAAEEAMGKRGKGALTMTGIDLSGKHPVTALMELSVRRRWGAPSFVQAFECGPPHKKHYVFKVTVNGETYQPAMACDNKKKAKADAATVALQELGLLPKDPNNPI